MSLLHQKYPNLTLPENAGEVSIVAPKIAVKIGGGMSSFGGIALFQDKGSPSANDGIKQIGQVWLKLQDEARQSLGIIVGYNCVHIVELDGKPVWINGRLPGAPRGGQDVSDVGAVTAYINSNDAEFMDLLRERLTQHRATYEKVLNMTFTGI